MAISLRLFRRPAHLRAHLITLVVAAVLPVVIFAGVMIVVASKQQQAAVDRGLLDTARALSLAVDRELEKAIAALATLATVEHLDSGDIRKFYQEAKRALAVNEGWETILLIDTSGQQIINLRQPFGLPLPRTSTSELDKKVIDSARPAVSNLFFGLLAKKPLVAVTIPVLRGGQVKYLLS